MSAIRRYGWLSLGVAVTGLWLVGCGGSDGGTTGLSSTPNAVVIVSGNNQVGLIGQALTAPLVVKVTNSTGGAVVGSKVTFTVAAGAASVNPATVATDVNGQAQTAVTIGGTAGTIVVTATVANTALVATFAITAGSGSSAAKACSSSSPQSFSAGQVSPGVGGTGICLSGGATGADFALVGFYGNPDSSQIQPLTVTSTNATAVTTADLTPATPATFNLAPISAHVGRTENNVQAAFEAKLRASERRDLTPKIAAARAWYRSVNTPSGALRNAIPATVTLGQILTLNGNGTDDCINPINIGARVAAIGTTSIIVADTTNPLPTFSDAEYQSFATMFDTLINPLDIGNFGQPTDIDHNGKILIFFTKEVNKLTPRGSGGVIGGFFFARDLFPITDNTALGIPGCVTSNVGEMFYVLVPDSAGVYSDPQTKTGVLNVTPGTLAHEYQHLINAGRRLYVNDASSFEVDWLNEGLSHIAEELLYYRISNFAPRQNLTAAVVGATQTAVDEFLNNQGDNFSRYFTFLGTPAQTSVFSAVVDTSLAARGAVWNMLRYLADHHGTSDGTTWSSLVNTTLIGQQNLANVFGADYLTQIRDWATSVFSDDVPGVTDARFEEPSWNMRDIFPHLAFGSGPALGKYPLKVFPLADNTPVSTTVFAGGAAYIRFHVAAGASASIDWSAGAGAVSSLMQFTVVRSQ